MNEHGEHDIRTERSFPVSREALFGAFADPEVLATWWGPRGSVNEFETFDLRPGGAWRFVMHAAGGQAYPMVHEFVEVSPPERIIFRHIQAGHGFELRMDYHAVGPAQTWLRWRMRFDDAAEAARVRPYVLAANEENLDRLAAALGVAPGAQSAPTGE